MSNKVSKSGRSKVWLTLLVLTCCIGCGIWWLGSAPVMLSEDHYAVSLALYRVCNQQNEKGLDQIETLIQSPQMQPDESDKSLGVIRAIIADARQQRWRQATISCRRLLDDQVQR